MKKIISRKDIEKALFPSLLCRTQGRKGNPVIFHSTALDLSLGEEKEQDIWKNILSQKQKHYTLRLFLEHLDIGQYSV